MISRNLRRAPCRHLTRIPNQHEPLLVAGGHRKWDPNPRSYDPSFHDWYGILREAGAVASSPTPPITTVALARRSGDGESVLVVVQEARRLRASCDTIEIYNAYWEMMIRTYRDVLCSLPPPPDGTPGC